MTIDYVYKLLGMKEVELNATRAERDQLKQKIDEVSLIIKRQQEEIAKLKGE